MEWWIWLIIVGIALLAVLALEWRSWKRPLSPGLEQGGGHWSDAPLPPQNYGNLKKPD